mmetsp:Transcript_62480/g.176218  ORF Transcript_62480/g.176218 Transcript_62480/m.176218 type:complete len:257 (+) Transcript_62480:40-810(+)
MPTITVTPPPPHFQIPAATMRLMEGVKEEMMVVMLNVLQAAADACAKVCIQRLNEQHRLMLHAFEEAAAQPKGRSTSVGSDEGQHASAKLEVAAVKRKAAAHQLAELGSTTLEARIDDNSEAASSASGGLETMYDLLDRAVDNVREALAARREELRELGCYDSGDEGEIDQALNTYCSPKGKVLGRLSNFVLPAVSRKNSVMSAGPDDGGAAGAAAGALASEAGSGGSAEGTEHGGDSADEGAHRSPDGAADGGRV